MNKPNVADHAREISFAVFRVCSLVGQPMLKVSLESAAIKLAANSVADQKEALRALEELDQLVRLAEVVGEIKPVNGKVLIRELSILRSAITPRPEAKKEDIDISEIFARSANDTVDVSKSALPSEKGKVAESVQSAKPPVTRFSKPVAIDINQSATRQSAILDYIRALPNGCRMKDLVQRFPDSSERTIRNDLQALVSAGSLERFGALQGPFSYYRVKGKSIIESDRGTITSLDDMPKSLSKEVTKGQIIAL